MKQKKKELEDEISNIWCILIIAKDCYQYSLYLHKPETNEEADYLKNSQDFQFIRHILWRMAIIEISKLFCDSKNRNEYRERYNLIHLLSKLKKDEYFGDLGFKISTIEKWETQFLLNKELISNILTLRDKVYAHTDSNKDLYSNIEITFEKIGQLINLTEEIIREIFEAVFESAVDFDSPNLRANGINIIKILAEEKKKRMDELIQSAQMTIK